MNWSITFAPLVPLPVLTVLAIVGVGPCRRAAVTAFARRADPLRGARGTDRGASQSDPQAGAAREPRQRRDRRARRKPESETRRPHQADGCDPHDLETKFAKIPNLNIKWVTGGIPGEQTAAGTNLFTDLNAALNDTAPDRIAGVLFVTDGQVHDVPKSAASLGFDAPVHTLLTGKPDEFDRRIEVIEAPRYGLVGQSRPIEIAVRETGKSPADGSAPPR